MTPITVRVLALNIGATVVCKGEQKGEKGLGIELGGSNKGFI